jgi:hypothetical protein
MVFSLIASSEGFRCDVKNKGRFMDKINQVLKSTNQVAKKRATSSSKMKWREIESIRDKFQLEKDLRSYESSLEHMLEEF